MTLPRVSAETTPGSKDDEGVAGAAIEQRRQKRWIWVLGVILAAGVLAPMPRVASQAPAPMPPGFDELERPILRWEATVTGWRKDATNCLRLTIAVGLLGICAAAAHPLPRAWGRSIAGACGLLVTAITYVTSSIYPADHRAYSRLAILANEKVDQIHDRLYTYPTEEARQKAIEEIRVRLHDLEVLQASFLKEVDAPAPRSSSTSWFELPAAHAQAARTARKKPSWVSGSVPASTADTLYYVGVAADGSLEAAGKASYANALETAAEHIGPQMPVARQFDTGALARYLAAGARSVDSYFEFDPDTKNYRYYTLVELKRSLIDIDTVLFGVQQNVKIPADVARATATVQSSSDSYFLKRAKASQQLLTTAQSSVPANIYKAFEDGRAARATGDHERAVRVLQSVVRDKPDFFLAWYNLGLAFEGLGQLDHANEAYAKAVALEPRQATRDPSLYNTYGWLLFRQARYAEAKPMFEAALAQDPDHPTAKKNLAATERELARARR